MFVLAGLFDVGEGKNCLIHTWRNSGKGLGKEKNPKSNIERKHLLLIVINLWKDTLTNKISSLNFLSRHFSLQWCLLWARPKKQSRQNFTEQEAFIPRLKQVKIILIAEASSWESVTQSNVSSGAALVGPTFHQRNTNWMTGRCYACGIVDLSCEVLELLELKK